MQNPTHFILHSIFCILHFLQLPRYVLYAHGDTSSGT
jgi:hypothetical protein